jgi:hypothetical protein
MVFIFYGSPYAYECLLFWSAILSGSTIVLLIWLIIRTFQLVFFRRNNIFLSQQISQQCFSAGLSAQPNETNACR